MHTAVWITHPEHKVLGDMELARDSIPDSARDFQLIDTEDQVTASGKFIIAMDDHDLAQELFRSILFMFPDHEDDIAEGKLVLKVGDKTFSQAPIQTTTYMSDEAVLCRDHGVFN